MAAPAGGRYIPKNGDGLPKIDLAYTLGSLGTNLAANSYGMWVGIYGEYFHGNMLRGKWADLAEVFRADMPLTVGTVVKLGGEFEVTISAGLLDFDVIGVVSERPAFLMNCGLEDGVKVGLIGQVDCRLIGTAKKGQRIVASRIPGVAEAITDLSLDRTPLYCIIGRVLEDKQTEEEGLCKVVLGVK